MRARVFKQETSNKCNSILYLGADREGDLAGVGDEALGPHALLRAALAVRARAEQHLRGA